MRMRLFKVVGFGILLLTPGGLSAGQQPDEASTPTLGKGLAWHTTFPGNFLASNARFPGKIVHSLKATREAWRAL